MKFNPTKRRTLKYLGVAGGSVALTTPALAGAKALQNLLPGDHSGESGHQLEIDENVSIYFSPVSNGKHQMITLSNNGKKAVELRQISPGVVVVQGRHYNINQLFIGRRSISLEPGHVKAFSLTESSAKMEIATALTGNRQLLVTTAYKTPGGFNFVQTTRSFA